MSSRRPLSKAEKSLGFICVFALLPLAAVVFIAGQRDAEPKWNIAPAAKRPNPNGTDFYVAAQKATVRFTPEVDAASDTKRPLPSDPTTSPYALQNYSLARRNQWLKANAKMFALFNQGLNTPSMAPDYATKPMGDWATLRQLARDVGARSRTFQMANQPMRATMSALDGMQMAQDSTRGGGLMARLVGIAMIAIGRSPLDDFDKTINQLNSTEASTAARRLEKLLQGEPSATQTLSVDKRDSLIELKRIFTLEGWRGGWKPGSSGYNSNETALQSLQRQTISKTAIYDNMNRALDARIANAALPYSKAIKTTLPPDLDSLTSSYTGSINRFSMNEARNATSNNMLLLRLALRAYIAQNKTAPPILSALVPTYLKAVPTDVYNDGKPLFYQAKGTTYKLWSVGPDMINNNGVPFPPRSAGAAKFPVSNTLNNKGDFVAGLCR